MDTSIGTQSMTLEIFTEFMPGSYFPPPQRESFAQHLTWILLAEIKVINLYPFYRCQGEQVAPAWSCTPALLNTTVGLILPSSLPSMITGLRNTTSPTTALWTSSTFSRPSGNGSSAVLQLRHYPCGAGWKDYFTFLAD